MRSEPFLGFEGVYAETEKNSANSSPKAFANFRKSAAGADLFAKLDRIEQLLEEQLKAKVALTSGQAREIINSVTYAEAIEAKKQAAEEKAWIEKQEKYIKAENLKVVEKLTDKYDYFK